jgi:hypothetical protein
VKTTAGNDSRIHRVGRAILVWIDEARVRCLLCLLRHRVLLGILVIACYWIVLHACSPARGCDCMIWTYQLLCTLAESANI